MADIIVTGLTSPLGKPRLMDIQGIQVSVPFPIVLSKQGGIGFQFEGGIIVVTGTATGVDVTFDRPMTFNGDLSPTPPGTPFNLGTPTLNGGSDQILSVPISVASPTVVAVVATPAQINVTFDRAITLTSVGIDPSNWGISGTIYPVTVLAVNQLNPTTVRLTTSNQNTGGLYSLLTKSGAVSGGSLASVGGSFPFVGLGVTPSVLSATPLSSNSLRVIFSEAVRGAEATVVSNYQLSNGLAPIGVVQNSPESYTIFTTDMVPGIIYTLVVSGVHDLLGNLVA